LANVNIFLSTVTAEFLTYRKRLLTTLTRPNVAVKVQEDFIPTGTETLIKLDDYIRECELVFHIVGNFTGAHAKAPSVGALLLRYPDFAERFPMLDAFFKLGGPSMSYTQWESWIALYHGRVLIIAIPTDDAPRDCDEIIIDQKINQKNHLDRLKDYERYPEISFTNVENLEARFWSSTAYDIIPQLQPPSIVLERIREMATSLLDVGRSTWKMPRLVAPLNLDLQEEKADSDPHSKSIVDLTKSVTLGENIVLFGEGGIGKTTLLLELSSRLLKEKSTRIPLFIDAAYWARTNTDILEYITNRPAAKMHKVTAAEIVKLAKSASLSLVVNGWNEVSPSQKSTCLARLRELTATVPALNIVVVSRSVVDVPDLKERNQVHVRGLIWQGQLEVMRSELDKDLASTLIELLARDTRLRHAARNPLILKGLIAQARKGELASLSVFDLLGAVIDEFEEDNERKLILEESPLRGKHHYFLEAVAYKLSLNQETTTSREDMMPVISAAAKQLVDSGQFVNPPESRDVLKALSSHHLLHMEGEAIRFAHQRFQEYFAATQLFRACTVGDEYSVALLRGTVNQPFWEDALLLVAGKLKDVVEHEKARSLLVRTVFEVDVGFACVLAGACAFCEADDGELYSDIVTHVDALCASAIIMVADYGIACLTASNFTVFADRLWSLIENEEQQKRLHYYRLNKAGISLKQLGEDADKRIESWSPECQAELMHELSDNPDNYDFIVRAANESAEFKIRAAAISALEWNFPASEAALQAWLKAPPNVQLDHNVLSAINFAVEQGGSSDEVRETIRTLSLEHSDVTSQLRLVMAFPDDVDPSVIDVILAELRDAKKPSYNDTPLVEFAKKNSLDKLNALAHELLLCERVIPDWICNITQEESDEIRSELFEKAWVILHEDNFQNLNVTVIGALANYEQTLRSMREWLNFECRRDLSEQERVQNRSLKILLYNSPHDNLIKAVIFLGKNATYQEAAELLELLHNQINYDDTISLSKTQWLPSSEDINTLISIFGKMLDDEDIPQHRVHVMLCSIASCVAPTEFSDLLKEGCRLHLDAWQKHHTVREHWLKNHSGPQPTNPYLGNYISSAMKNWGFEALPFLVGLLDAPHANHLVPESILRIVSFPWSDTKKGVFQSIVNDFQDGKGRQASQRVLLQPDDTHQEMTDVAAKALGSMLIELVNKLQLEKAESGEKWNDRNAAYRIRSLSNIVVNIPSPEIVEPITYAVASGFMDLYGLVNVLRGLVRQGVVIEDPTIITQIETLFTEEAKATWFDTSTKYEMSVICELMFSIRQVSLLTKPLSEYLIEWQRFAHINEIIRHLGVIPSEETLRCLILLGNELTKKGITSEELIFALTASLTCDNFNEFLEIISDGTFLNWSKSAYRFEQVAHDVLHVIGDNTSRLKSFLDACDSSSSPYAVVFACAVLSIIPNGDAIRVKYGLSALDEGRISDSHNPVYLLLMGMFTLREQLGDQGMYEVHPKACNDLRHELYIRAKKDGDIAIVARKLLADIECLRWESGRPADELRHPHHDDMTWSKVLVISS